MPAVYVGTRYSQPIRGFPPNLLSKSFGYPRDSSEVTFSSVISTRTLMYAVTVELRPSMRLDTMNNMAEIQTDNSGSILRQHSRAKRGA